MPLKKRRLDTVYADDQLFQQQIAAIIHRHRNKVNEEYDLDAIESLISENLETIGWPDMHEHYDDYHVAEERFRKITESVLWRLAYSMAEKDFVAPKRSSDSQGSMSTTASAEQTCIQPATAVKMEPKTEPKLEDNPTQDGVRDVKPSRLVEQMVQTE